MQISKLRLPTAYKKCTGCRMCASICNCEAIEVIENKEGFNYPLINSKCIDCGQCKIWCPQNNVKKKENEKKESYAVYSLSDEIRENSSSGGIFYELATSVINSGGYVCGAIYDEKLYVRHTLINKNEDIHKLMVSKYMQSNIGDVFHKVEKLLIEDATILFCGTPCQVDALKMYLDCKKIERNLITIDLLCFGISSPKAAHEYIKEIEMEYHKKVKYVTLKDKSFGWHNQKSKYVFEDETYIIIEDAQKDFFSIASFEEKFCIRQSCFECKYKATDRVADITIGDFWGIKDFDMDDNKGTNAVIINSIKGSGLFQNLIENGQIKYKNCRMDDIVDGNPNAFNNRFYFNKERRDYFWKALEEEKFSKAVIMAKNMG